MLETIWLVCRVIGHLQDRSLHISQRQDGADSGADAGECSRQQRQTTAG